MIHALQIIAVKRKYDQCAWRRRHYPTAEIFYEHLLGVIIGELATTTEGKQAVLIAAQLYYEDWSITSMERLKETDRKLRGRDGYLAIELIRQLVQGEPCRRIGVGNASSSAALLVHQVDPTPGAGAKFRSSKYENRISFHPNGRSRGLPGRMHQRGGRLHTPTDNYNNNRQTYNDSDRASCAC